jgi:hypothetical protein
MKIENGTCKGCSYFKRYSSIVKGNDPYQEFRTYYEDGEDESFLYVGKCEKCNIDISLKYLKDKKSCPFVNLASDVRLVRIWSVVWNSNS